MAYKEEDIKIIFESICERIENGEAVRNILKNDNMPSSKTFFKWIYEDEEKVKRYARAKEIYAETMFEDIILISDGTGDDVLIDEDGKENINYNIIQRDKLRTDNRKWVLSKLNPKKYGDKIDVTSGDKPLQDSKVVMPEGTNLEDYLKDKGLL